MTNIINPLHLDMIERFRQFANAAIDMPNEPLPYPDDFDMTTYILDLDILLNSPISDDDSLCALRLHLDDELHEITLIAIFDAETLAIRHLLLEADTNWDSIPI